MVLTVGLVSVLHYVTNPAQIVRHEILQHMYYVPVVLGGYWFGATGGLATAAFTSLLYLPHIRMTWADNYPYVVNQYADVLVFHVIGLTVGLLSTSQLRTAQRYQQAAGDLRMANRELLESFEHVRRADRLSSLGEIAAGLAHEVRNPLGSIQGAIEILRDRAQPDTPEAEFSQLALTELGRLNDLVSEFLSYARPRTPEAHATSLATVIEHVRALVGPQADQVNVSIEVETDPRGRDLLVDDRQMAQALFNVVLNAIQVSPPGVAVRIVERHLTDAAIIEVSDRGPGIPVERRGKIFDPFFTTKDGGTGLGLAIAERIVESHGGRIEIDSSPTAGTCVRFRLPLTTQAHPDDLTSASTDT